MRKLTPIEVYNELQNDKDVFKQCGKITFSLGDVSVVVKHRDAVGNILQEWLEEYFKRKNIYYSINENTQMPPDFYLSENRKESLLEIKAFNCFATPAFAIAEFNMYADELITSPWVLDTKYLIFGYMMDSDGSISIKDIWLKNVWEITRNSKNWALKLQVKRGVIQEIRPASFNKNKKVFDSKEDFVSAVENVIYKNPSSNQKWEGWRDRFLENYEKHFGYTIAIPEWDEIREKYTDK